MQAGLPALLGAAAKCFCLGSSFHKHQGANSAIPSLLQAAPDSSGDSWVTEMGRARQEPAGNRVPAASRSTRNGQFLALVCTTQTSWRVVQRSGTVAHAGLRGQLHWGI